MLRSARGAAAGMERRNGRRPRPGAFELPIARRLARRKDIDAVLCFGLGPDGRRPTTTGRHGRHPGITAASMETDKPILGVSPASRWIGRSALPESEGGKEDKGREVARAALESLEAPDACESKPNKDRMGF